MNQTSPMNTATAAGAAAVISPVIAYLATLCGLKLPPEVLGSLVVILVAGAHWAGDLLAARATKAAPPAPAAQGGYSPWYYPLVVLLFALAAVFMTGCTTTTGSMYRGFATQAKAGIEVFDDNTLSTMHDLLCAQPYSAIQRHPEMQAGIQQLCGPLANASSLDAGQLQLLMSVIGKAQAAGLLAVPAQPVKP